MNQSLANTLTNMSENIVSMGIGLIIVILFIAVLCLTRLVWQLKRDCINLAKIVESNKNDIYGLCSAALTVNENTVSTHEQLHELKQQVIHLIEKITELEQNDFMNSPYNIDIRKIRSGAGVEELMIQSDLSYDEAALLIRLHGDKS